MRQNVTTPGASYGHVVAQARIHRNLFCDSTNLNNEADVEAEFVERLLKHLGYPSNRIRRKNAIEELPLPTTGSRPELYRPDYILLDSANNPVVVVDAKNPAEQPAKYRYQVTGYALLINQRFSDNPVRYCVVSNGLTTEVLKWDFNTPLLTISFNNFDPGNNTFADLRATLAYASFNQERAVQGVRPTYRRPTTDEVVDAFKAAHDVIRNKEKSAPTEAFYELAKLLFVKLRQDRQIHELIATSQIPRPEDFYFTVDWINNQPGANPVADYLFRQLHTDLEADITSGRKKRIFHSHETIDLKPSTVLEVVRLLEEFDLHGIDEDLNGRMFEAFLNATVRGKELGQFFTPRSVVKYMTKAACLRLSEGTLPRIIDACCGSGGFLIEALAELSASITTATHLTNTEQQHLLDNLHRQTLYGIEANERIGRIARLNMYLHGDGGSRVYVADSLDQELVGEEGVPHERTQQLDELRGKLLDARMRFDVALTNPPFSMSYKSTVPDERRILSQYAIASGASANSNVLFLERYHELLEADGELLTIIDDTVLNGTNAQAYRDFIREHFIIRQVVSLPFNTFFRAQANIKTSILHLRRRRSGEVQGDVFMAITNNVGHDDSKYDTPHLDNLPGIAQLFIDWHDHGRRPSVFRQAEVAEPLGCPLQVFVVPAEQLAPHRLDAFWYAPELRITSKPLSR
jgi:type I restriction enzyme M protein